MKRALFSRGRFTCHGRFGKGASGQVAALHWSGLRCAPTPLRCSVSRPRRITRFVRYAHCTQTNATSQMWMRAARAATSPVLLGAPEARCGLPGRAFADRWCLVFVDRTKPVAARQAYSVRGNLWGGEEHSHEVGAQSAHPHLTRRGCLNAANEVSAVSSATRPQDDNEVAAKADNCAKRLSCRSQHRSGVGAKRRPPQWEPLAEYACRAEQQRH